jgi:hypothetical protein
MANPLKFTGSKTIFVAGKPPSDKPREGDPVPKSPLQSSVSSQVETGWRPKTPRRINYSVQAATTVVSPRPPVDPNLAIGFEEYAHSGDSEETVDLADFLPDDPAHSNVQTSDRQSPGIEAVASPLIEPVALQVQTPANSNEPPRSAKWSTGEVVSPRNKPRPSLVRQAASTKITKIPSEKAKKPKPKVGQRQRPDNFGVEFDVPKLPKLPEESSTAEIKPDGKILSFDTTETLLDTAAEKAEIGAQAIFSGTPEEQQISPEAAPPKDDEPIHAKQEGLNEVEEEELDELEKIAISVEQSDAEQPGQLQTEKTISDSDAEFDSSEGDFKFEVIHLETLTEVDLDAVKTDLAKIKTDVESLVPDTARRKKLESRRKLDAGVARQMVSPTKIATDIDGLIRNSNDPGTENARNRIINMLACAAGAKNVHAKSIHPETTYCAILTTLPAANRLSYLKSLYAKMGIYLSANQRELIEDFLKRIEASSQTSLDANNRDFALRLLKSALWKELEITAPQ